MQVRHKYKYPGAGLLLFIAVLFVTGCSNLDVVAKGAVTSFTPLLQVINHQLNTATNSWDVVTPDNQSLSIAVDFSAAGPDFQLSLDAAPFLAAGLDPSRLPGNYALVEPAQRLMINFDIGTIPLAAYKTASLPELFRSLVATYRANISYHDELDHFGIKLGDGNMFEWARDMAANDKDAVIVLNPEPFIKAGVDPDRIEGWKFARVNIKEPDGRKVQVDKILKPYNFK